MTAAVAGVGAVGGRANATRAPHCARDFGPATRSTSVGSKLSRSASTRALREKQNWTWADRSQGLCAKRNSGHCQTPV